MLGAIIPPSSLRAPVCRHCSRRLNAAPPPSHGCPLIRNWIPIFPLLCLCLCPEGPVWLRCSRKIKSRTSSSTPPSPYHPELYAHIFIGGRIPSMPLFFKSLVSLAPLVLFHLFGSSASAVIEIFCLELQIAERKLALADNFYLPVPSLVLVPAVSPGSSP